MNSIALCRHYFMKVTIVSIIFLNSRQKPPSPKPLSVNVLSPGVRPDIVSVFHMDRYVLLNAHVLTVLMSWKKGMSAK